MKKELFITSIISIFISILIMGGVMFAFSWNEPTEEMPDQYQDLLNTGEDYQYKTGEIGSVLFRDVEATGEDTGYYLNPSGNSKIAGKITSEAEILATDSDNTLINKKYLKDSIKEEINLYTSFMGINLHTAADCVGKGGGEAITLSTGVKICRFSCNYNPSYVSTCGKTAYYTNCTQSCSSGWQQYQNWCATGVWGYSTGRCQCCFTQGPSHGWENTPPGCVTATQGYTYWTECAPVISIGCY